MRILMCTDGSPIADRAIQFGAPIALAAGAEVTLLGIAKSPEIEPMVRASLDQARALFPGPVEEKLRHGRAANEILAESAAGSYDFIVMGSRGRKGLQRLAFGSVAARLARYARRPVLIVKGARTPVRRVLACTSGAGRSERVARWGGRLAHWLNAELTVLHVMSQIALSPEANFDELEETAEEAIAQKTREGQQLAREMELVSAQGALAQAKPKLRHGLVMEEIVEEATKGDYDLIVIGGHQAPDFPGTWNELKDFLLADVADQIVSTLKVPVLVVKGE